MHKKTIANRWIHGKLQFGKLNKDLDESSATVTKFDCVKAQGVKCPRQFFPNCSNAMP